MFYPCVLQVTVEVYVPGSGELLELYGSRPTPHVLAANSIYDTLERDVLDQMLPAAKAGAQL